MIVIPDRIVSIDFFVQVVQCSASREKRKRRKSNYRLFCQRLCCKDMQENSSIAKGDPGFDVVLFFKGTHILYYLCAKMSVKTIDDAADR